MKYWFFSLFPLVFASGLALATEQEVAGPYLDDADDEQVIRYNLSTPQLSLITFTKYLREENFRPEVAAKVLFPYGPDSTKSARLAIQLKQVLVAKGVFIDVEEVPGEANYVDSSTKKERYYVSPLTPDIYLEKYERRWYFARKTVARIQQMHKDAYPFGTDKLLNLIPNQTDKYLGLHIWQLLGIFIILLVSFFIHKVITWLSEQMIARFIEKFGHEHVANKFILPVAIPFSLTLVFYLITVFVPVLQLPVKMNHYVVLGMRATLPFFITLVFYQLVNVLTEYLQKLAEKTPSTLDDQLVPLVRKVLKVFVVVVGLLFILQNLAFDITALIAGLSIGGLAFALAAQDTIKNLFGSLMVFVDKPFQIGHWIVAGEIDGTVEEVGFRSTRVRTFYNSLIYVPNGKLADMVIDNYGMRKYRRFRTNLTIVYGTPIDKIEAFVAGLKKIVTEHPRTRKDYMEIHLNDLAAYSYNVLFYIFFEVPTWSEELACRHEVLIKILRLAEELGIEFAFPTQKLFLEKEGDLPKEIK